MASIHPCPLPPAALLLACQRDGSYADCYATDVARAVSHAEFVEAFYTTRTFALERLVLKLFAGKPSTHADAKALAEGRTEKYAAWTVEGRAPDQLGFHKLYSRVLLSAAASKLGERRA